MTKFARKIAVILLVILGTVCIAGASACMAKNVTPDDIDFSDIASTERKEVPDDGSTPLNHTALENIAYMAYVLDNQPFYHAYAKNSTKSTGYEQVTQTWKDYKSAEQSGTGESVMVCSDLSYSALVKSATQSCFIGGTEAYMRSGSKPAKSSGPADVTWNTSAPDYYTRQTYLVKYGDFSTELCVYVINEDTLIKADSAVDNKDGTYSQKFYLNEGAACWYQYGMKTRGGLKDFPAFEKIEITFTFDSQWQVLSTYCEEKAAIAPGALAGMTMTSTSATTTAFDYGANNFDTANYGYFDSYFKQYVGTDLSGSDDVEENPDILTLLGNGFSEVVDPAGNGKQFNIYLTMGNTDYSGKIYMKLADMSDILGSLDVRFQIGKEGANQDLYVEFKDGAVNAYYSDLFAVTADLGKVSQAVGKITQWIDGFNGKLDAQTVAYAISGDEEESSGLDLNSLLSSLELTFNSNTACIKLKTDDLLGLGIGLNVQINFDCVKDDNGTTYSFNSLYMNSLSYNSQSIQLSGTIVPDTDKIVISRNPSDTVADLADYIDGVSALLSSKTYEVSLNLDGTSKAIEYINGLVLDARAQVQFTDSFRNIAVSVPMSVSYGSIDAELTAYYTLNINGGSLGEVYLHLTKLGDTDTDAKIYCGISEVRDAVEKLLNLFKTQPAGLSAQSGTSSETRTVADIVNTVLGLNFGDVITQLKANENSIEVTIDADEILTILGVDIGLNLGKVSLSAMLDNGKLTLGGKLPELGLSVGVSGSDSEIAVPDKSQYADVTEYVNGVYGLINSKSFLVDLSLDGTCQSIELLNGLTLSANAQIEFENSFSLISVKAPVTVAYKGLTAELSLFYTVNLNNGGYGCVYLDLTKLNGKDVTVKIYCDIEEVANSVTRLINYFTDADGAESEAVAYAVEALTDIDFASLINSIRADGDGININVNADAVLSFAGLDLGGIQLGNVGLNLSVQDGKLIVAGGVSAYGLNFSLEGTGSGVSKPDTEGYSDITAYIDGVYELLNSKSFTVDIGLDGSCDSISYINGLTLTASAQIKLDDGFSVISVNAPLTVNYKGLSISLSVYYTINLEDGDYGYAYLTVEEINGYELSARVRSDIKSLKEGIEDLINTFPSPAQADEAGQTAEGASKIGDIVSLIAGLDFAKIIENLKVDGEDFTATLNVDEILNALNLNLGFDLGSLNLALGIDNLNRAKLTGSIETFGLSLSIQGSSNALSAPVNVDGYLDLVELIELIKDAYNQAEAIIKAQDIDFDINATVTLDGVAMNVAGNGEVSWVDGKIKVALDLTLVITDTGKGENAFNTLKIKFVYDGTDEEKPIVRLAINNLALEIHLSDVEEVKEGIDEIISAVKGLSGGTASALSDEEVSASGQSLNLYGINFDDVLKLVMGAVGDVTVKLEDKNLLITYSVNGGLSLGADGGLNLNLFIKDNGLTDIINLSASVKAGDCSTLKNLNQTLDEGGYVYYNDKSSFVKAVYNYLLDVLDDVTVGSVLGSDTYTVNVLIDGTQSGIDALDGVTVNACLYYSESNGGNGSKLLQADLDLNIKGTAVNASVYYYEKYLYVKLNSFGATLFTDMMFKASADDIYGAAEAIVELITSDTLSKLVSMMSASEPEALIDGADGEVTAKEIALTEVINVLLTYDFGSVIKFEKTDGLNSVTVNPDGILQSLGMDIKIGTVYAESNPQTHEIKASVTGDNGQWLTLDAKPVTGGTVLQTDKYLDVSFISQLLTDVKAMLDYGVKTETVTENEIQSEQNKLLFSYTGTIKIELKYSVISATITLNDAVVTAGLDGYGDFYFTLNASIGNNKAKLIGISTLYITEAAEISINYCNGYVTLGRDGVYKIMTLEYLLDNALAKSNSPVQWLLQTNSTVWSQLIKAIPLSLSSGLTTPQTIELYELAQAAKEDGNFYLSSILNGYAVYAGGKSYSYKTGSDAVSKLNLSDNSDKYDNYYAFDLNGSYLTGKVVSTMYAAVLSDILGISGIMAFLNVAGYVDVTVTLDGRADDADNLFKTISKKENINFNYFDGAEKNTSAHTTPIFGCYDMTLSGDARYIASEILDTVTLIVVDTDGEITEYDLSYGSTVYLTSVWAPEWTDDNKTYTYVYKNSDGNEITETSIVLTADEIIYIYKAEGETLKREIVYHTGVAGVDSLSAAFTLNGETVTLETYEIDGYVLLNWYWDENYTVAITAEEAMAFGGTDVYCIYTVSEKTYDGVIYTLVKEDGEYVYHVTGYDENGIKAFAEYDTTLVLKNVIELNGITYRVTAIEENAFAEANIKNIVVPSNIIKVGSLAFLDNVDMRTATFLADNVTFEGSVGKKSDGGYPFYGCSVTGDDNSTNLTVYFNSINGSTATNSPSWAHFRSQSSLFSTSYYYIGAGGGRLVNGGFAYIEFDVASPVAVSCLENGVKTESMTIEAIIGAVMNELNGRTYGDGYINGYTVEVSRDITLNNSIYKISVSISESSLSDRYFALNVKNTGTVNESLACDSKTFENTLYVRYGTLVTVSSAIDGFAVNAVSATVATQTQGDVVTFVMADYAVDITVECLKKSIEEVTIISKAEFSYAGFETVLMDDGYYYVTVTGVEEGKTQLSDAAADGYTFLGYTYKDGESFIFADGVVNYPTYYAVWAVNRDYVSYGKTVSGELPADGAVTVDGSYAQGFEGWYTDYDFSSKITNLSLENSILYARLKFNFTLYVSGSSTQLYYRDDVTRATEITNSSKTGTVADRNTNLKSFEITVNEGQYIRIDTEDSYKVLYVYILDSYDQTVKDTAECAGYRFRAYKYASSINQNQDNQRYFMQNTTEKYANFTEGVWYQGNRYGSDDCIINKDTKYAATETYVNSGSGNTYYYGAIAKADSSLSATFTV